MSRESEKDNHYLLKGWRPENPAFWENKGKAIARRNLFISVSCLLLAFLRLVVIQRGCGES